MFDNTIQKFIELCRRPGMVGQSPSYETVCAFIDGYTSAQHGAPLEGFREFLLSDGSGWSNAPWWAIIRMRVVNDWHPLETLAPADEEEARQQLASALERYLDARKEGGIGLVFHRYNTWLLSLSDPSLERYQTTLKGHATMQAVDK